MRSEPSSAELEAMHNAQYDGWFAKHHDMDKGAYRDKQLLHPCPDWDGMVVDALDREGEGSCCTCDRELLRNPETVANLQSAYWPFPITNGVRNPESQTLLDTKGKLCATIKPDLDNEQDALM